LSFNFIIGCWDYTLDRDDMLVSGEMCVTVCTAVSRKIQCGRNDTGRERVIDRGGKSSKAMRILGKTQGSDKCDSQQN
jgi:hypothetical protein